MVKEFYTQLNSYEIFLALNEGGYSFVLDSAMDPDKLGRYSFIGAKPYMTFKSKLSEITIEENGECRKIIGNPFKELERLICASKSENTSGLPFIGGAVGYFGYDMCHHIEKLSVNVVDDVNIPDCFFGFYDKIIVIDHKENRYYAVSPWSDRETSNLLEDMILQIKKAEKSRINTEISSKKTETEFRSNFKKEAYINAISRVKDYIAAGDIYQANLTQRFECKTERSPIELYGILRSVSPAPFAGYLDIGEAYILSSSPERFLRINNKTVETRPIKGTRPRGRNEEEDKKNKQELLNSEKDKAELLMIVDLERNDIGRVSEPGSVKVTELYVLEQYANVYHLVSTIIGNINAEATEMDAIMAAFPGGSITGAPKIRAMEIIDELEPTARNIYTGSIGYIGFDGSVDLNIAIRTILLKDDTAYFQVGGAIVWDSEPEDEYQETLHKASGIMKALKY